ncbi:MAG TPA: pyridoxamine 5'-phosphate oxidase [Steroidobacteraceae bacterium]|nr:pyridoxamine 5'-phosphate oxidase [Steroidobacteraceae bacterium]
MSRHTELLPDPLPGEPLLVINRWLAESWKLRQQPNPNSMVLATVDPDGRPSARVVLCKEIVPQPGYLVFYTNYLSRKGMDLTRNPRAALVMHWDGLHRQVRVEGPVVQAPAADSDAYFASRPWQSRLGAWASAQSQPVASRQDLQAAVADAARRFGTPVPFGGAGEGPGVSDFVIPRPPHWGGFHIWAEAVELWVEGEARIHDRARWTRPLTKRADGLFDAGPWNSTRLQP